MQESWTPEDNRNLAQILQIPNETAMAEQLLSAHQKMGNQFFSHLAKVIGENPNRQAELSKDQKRSPVFRIGCTTSILVMSVLGVWGGIKVHEFYNTPFVQTLMTLYFEYDMDIMDFLRDEANAEIIHNIEAIKELMKTELMQRALEAGEGGKKMLEDFWNEWKILQKFLEEYKIGNIKEMIDGLKAAAENPFKFARWLLDPKK